MKKMFLAMMFVALAMPAQAVEALGWISYITCAGGVPGVGGATVMFTGSGTFNVTEYNMFGFPFSQQTLTMRGDVVGNETTFYMKGLLNNETYKLTLVNASYEGTLEKSDGTKMDLKCSGKIEIF